MRLRILPLILLTALVVPACGGGGAPSTLVQAKAQIDGSTAELGGVEIVLVETGERAVTGPDGSFRFPDAPVGSVRLALASAPRVLKSGSGEDRTGAEEGVDDDSADDSADEDSADDGDDDSGDDDATEDELDDGNTSTETEVELFRISDGENIRVRLRVRDGRLERVEVSRSDHDEREVEMCLRRTETNDDADMKGCLEIEERSDRSRLKVEVEHADAGREIELFVIDPDGLEESQGALTVDVTGEAQWELDGAALPFGVTSVAGLEGYDVVVRDATTGADLLVGSVPELPVGASASGDGDDDEDGESEDTRERGRARLIASETGLEGHVEIRKDTDGGRQRFDMEAEHLAPGRAVEFFIEDALGSGVFGSLGIRTADSEGEAELELHTNDGASLPNRVTDVAELVGFAVEIRDAATGAVLLDGTVPALAAD